MMNQSHQGLNSQSWDRLAIIVENNKATFLQLPAGKLEWSDDLLQKQLANKVSCFICHANGPRAIRPEDTPAVKISISDRFKILLLNLKINSYGRIEENSLHKIQDIDLVTPFRHRGVKDNERLMVKTCLKCHSNMGFMARGYLTRQNSMTIDFMINNKLMPPLGIGLSAIEKRQVRDFIGGF